MFVSEMRHQRGFTLIEMSIVLVIIGLIIGGILKGQELIESARQKNVVSAIDTLRAGVTTFTDRYRSFPGDYGAATSNISGCSTTVCFNGNDDGLLNALASANTTAALMTFDGVAAPAVGAEKWNFFSQLVAADLIGGSLAPVASAAPNFAGGASPSPLPSAPWPQSGMDIVYGVHGGATTNGHANRTHWLRVKRFATNVVATNYVVSPNRLAQLDQKFDDGLAMDGRIRSSNVGTICNAAGSNTYVGTSTELGCHIIIALE